MPTKITRKMKLKEDLKKEFSRTVNTKQHTKILKHILECSTLLYLKVSYRRLVSKYKLKTC